MISVSRYLEYILDGWEASNIFGNRRQSVVNQKKEEGKKKKKTPNTKNLRTFLSCGSPAELCKYYCTDDQPASVALLKIKHNPSYANDFLLISSSTTRFKTSFFTSVTTSTSHHWENQGGTPPKINGAEDTWISKGSTLHFPAYTWIHEGNKPDYLFNFHT